MDTGIGYPLNPKINHLPSLNLHWPPACLSQQEQNLLNDFFKVAAPFIIKSAFHTRSYQKKRIYILEESGWYLPISVTFLMISGQIQGIILLLNRKRGKALRGGNQQVPKTAYDVLHGRTVVKKQASDHELALIDHLIAHPSRGITQIIGKRFIVKTNKVKKNQYFECLYEGTLTDWIGKPSLSLPIFKLFLINSLLRGLSTLQKYHAIAKSSVNFFRSFHGDIKPANIFISKQGIYLADFGMSNLTKGFGFTPAYAHPIFSRWRVQAYEERTEFIEKHGCLFDLWSMGIVMTIILRNQFSTRSKTELPPLGFIENRIHWFHEYGRLEQKEVDEELELQKTLFTKVNNANEVSLLKNLWDLAKSFLRVDLVYSTDLEKSIEITSELLESYAPDLKKEIHNLDSLFTIKRMYMISLALTENV